MAKAIGTLGNVDSLTVGGMVFTDITNLIALGGYMSTNATRYCTLRKADGVAGYAVTTAKTLTVHAMYHINLGGTNIDQGVGYSTNDCGQDSTTAPTGLVNIWGFGAAFRVLSSPGAVGNGMIIYPKWPVPAGKYISVTGNGSAVASNIYAFGYEA